MKDEMTVEFLGNENIRLTMSRDDFDQWVKALGYAVGACPGLGDMESAATWTALAGRLAMAKQIR